MVRELVLFMLLLVGIPGCSSAPVFIQDGTARTDWAGGQLQLFFSNPEYSSDDYLVQRDVREREAFGKRGGYPSVHGGIGAMQVWRF